MDRCVGDIRPALVYCKETLLEVRYSDCMGGWLMPDVASRSYLPGAEETRPAREMGKERWWNLRSVNNSLDGIQVYARYCSDFRKASLLCLTET